MPRYIVAVNPNDPKQERDLLRSLPRIIKSDIAGGEVYLAGSFYSNAYAGLICQRYRELNYVSFVEKLEESAS